MRAFPRISRRGWVATWLQRRRRARHHVVPAPAAVTLLTGPLAYWRLDEEPGCVRSDAVGDLNLWEWDYYGDPASINQTGGVIENAAGFTDADGLNQGLIVTGVSAWNITDDFSVAGWFRYTGDVYDGQSIFNFGNNLALGIIISGGCLGLWIVTGEGDTTFLQSPENSVWPGIWTQCVLTKEGDTIRFYLNGEESASGILPGAVVAEENPELHLGCGPAGYPLNGALDEFGLWQRALPAEEVAQLYNDGNGLSCDLF